MIERPARIGSLDVGSNALRLAIAEVADRQPPRTLVNAREPVRLGRDVFTTGRVSEQTARQAIEAFRRFRHLLDQHQVTHWAAVATSALREARNRDRLINRIARQTGIRITVIGAEEEARLVHLAVARRVDLAGQRALLIDIGGGSVEVTIVVDGAIVATDSFRLGAVRLLQELAGSRSGEQRFDRLVRESVDAARGRLRKEIGRQKVDVGVATGGNVEALGDLRRQCFGKDNDSLKRSELEELIGTLQAMTVEERIRQLDLRPDRADVIVPGAIVLQTILRQAGLDEVRIPHVGVKDGLLLDLLLRLRHEEARRYRDQVLASARQLGRKYRFDESHAKTVAGFALQLFDETRALHRLDDEHRLLLEVAALLHEIGYYISTTAHHKHSHYLVIHSPLIGLTDLQRAIVANVARYHRKSPPRPDHESYRALPPKHRLVVARLAALLRIADALDKEHGGKVKGFQVECRNDRVVVRLRGRGDLLLERWAFANKSDLFEEVFGKKVLTGDAEPGRRGRNSP